ncbi:cobalt-precorrin-7 (C(5))-methyltransferase [Halobacterium salinarum]|uniref:cobalt-precorrin-7 (C(5))-methyltransferase n=1 Tax=Halobacterium salinarum TaxID=2242 RepID=UPI001F405DAC|nr:cobalt-precorrin-7 (C(5))-methyltransferase [Halobacterium salinarum]MCF2208517.1 cobalt-precorrin-7 (C(5))-methyltransferase [Halobacterium salinarum]
MSEEYDLDSGPDPASFAAQTPEPAAGDHAVHAVGIGPGNPAFLTARGERAIRDAEVIVGFETVVEFVADLTDADLLTCGYRDEQAALSAFGERVADGARGTAVLMGDPNHSGYQFLGKVERAVGEPVRVVPGISSLQVAASRARTPMEDTAFVTLHRSGDVSDGVARLRDAVGDRHLLVLPRPFDLMPGDIAADLLEAADAAPDLDALVLERLTHDDESITRTTLGELAAHAGEETPFSDLSVLAVRRSA